MSDQDADIAAVLDSVVELGTSPRETELGAAVSRHVSNRPPTRQSTDTAAALRTLAHDGRRSPLKVIVDVNDLLDQFGETETWIILGKLKDLFGAPS